MKRLRFVVVFGIVGIFLSHLLPFHQAWSHRGEEECSVCRVMAQASLSRIDELKPKVVSPEVRDSEPPVIVRPVFRVVTPPLRAPPQRSTL